MKWLSDQAIERLREEADLPDLGGSKYMLLRKLGSGGMGSVYLAQDADLGRKVAIKVMNITDSTGALASRMMREARIVALLEHPSIVPIHDVGTLADGRVYYAMKLVQGARLDQSSRGGASLQDLLRIFQKVCEAVAFAHSRGVIHRDLKPENIMVGPFGEVLVMDWGVAKVLADDRSEKTVLTPMNSHDEIPSNKGVSIITTLPLAGGSPGETGDGVVIGTPAYMAPEQALGKVELLDQRSDVYALGAVLYFLLVGRAPFDSSPTTDAVKESTRKPPPRPRQINSSIPKAIEAVCLKAMFERRADRYASAEEVTSDVTKFLDGQQTSAYRENIFEKVGRWLGKNRFIVLLILTYLTARLVVFFWMGR